MHAKVIVIATSIAPSNVETQRRAVDSWLELGFSVVSLNIQSEIEQLSCHYPRVKFIPVVRDAASRAGKPLVYLDDVLSALAGSGAAVCGIINSDVELRAKADFSDFIANYAQNGIVYGSRIDIDSVDDSQGKEYLGGFDYFFFSHDVIDCFPRTEFCLGSPWWDYWMPLAPLLAGLSVRKLNSPVAYHRIHDIRWQPELFESLGNELQRIVRDHNIFLKESARAWEQLFCNDGLSVNEFCRLLRVMIKQQSETIYYGDVPKLPKISIVTPSFNQGNFLEKTIVSVLDQGYPNLEYIIIDGGSTDNSAEIIRRYEQHLAYWESEPDRGQSHAINKGFARATGDILAWLNSDDWYAPSALQSVVETFAANPDAGAVVGAGYLVDEEDYPVLRADPFEVTVETLYHWVDRFFWQPSCFFTRQTWERCGPLREDLHFAMDLDLWFKIARHYAFATTANVLSTSLRHADAKTTANTGMTRIEAARVILEHGGGREAYESLQQYIEGQEAGFVEACARVRQYDHDLADTKLQVAILDQQVAILEQQLSSSQQKLAMARQQLAESQQKLTERDQQLAESRQQLAACARQLSSREQRIEELMHSLSWKLTAPVRAVAAYPLIRGIARNILAHTQDKAGFAPCRINVLYPIASIRPRIVHVLANFMTGGSSRLVADLIEHLGHLYEQEVITSRIPIPAHYTGVKVHEICASDKIADYFETFRPELVHVHYWGECDQEWYEMVFRAAAGMGCKVIENVNAPVDPYMSSEIDHYVYVSNYVQETFGRGAENGMTIYPGSDFSLFDRPQTSDLPDDCIGMVYRLESDKLNLKSIEPFIDVVRRRPQTRVLIVGGGSYLAHYQNTARAAGVIDAFEFTGHVSYDRLPTFYEKMSIFVAPVWKESFGQVSPIAMHMGIPVVGYDVGGLSEIVGDDGLLAPPGDRDRLAEIIISLLDDRERRLAIGAANRERARARFSVESMIEAYAGLYGELLGHGG